MQTKSQKQTENPLKTDPPHQRAQQKGQGLIEYLILVALIAVATMGAIRIVGQSMNVKLAKVAESLGAKVQGQIGNAEVSQTSWKKKDMKDFMQGSLGSGRAGSSQGQTPTNEGNNE